jgi:hypothetical protein
LGLFYGQILDVLKDGESWVPTDPGGSRFFHKLLRRHLACLERQGTQENRKQMHTSKLSPNPKTRIMTILHQFRDKAARHNCIESHIDILLPKQTCLSARAIKRVFRGPRSLNQRARGDAKDEGVIDILNSKMIS